MHMGWTWTDYDLKEKPLKKIMGILNMTPDSFYDGGRYNYPDSAHDHVRQMISSGVDIIDVGGESTRPGAASVETSQEINRTLPVIKTLCQEFSVAVSVDTRKPEVAHAALQAGASWVNDISGGTFDQRMFDVVSQFDATIVMMHMLGTPENMQKNPVYDDVVADISKFFELQIEKAKNKGVNKIIIDPGIGFGKTVQHNLEILRRLDEFKKFDLPLMIGTSRKSFIGKILNNEVQDRLTGTLSTLNWSLLHGADILRVHDVRDAHETVRMIDSIQTGIYAS